MVRVARIRGLLAACLLAALAVSACEKATRRNAVPNALQTKAFLPNYPTSRYFPMDAGHVAEFERAFLNSNEFEKEDLAKHGHKGPLPRADYLAVSGGGDGGAFGAGLLNGWTKAGTRPVFKMVTGISTGALIAPFAFLGSEYDEKLRAFYTNISAKDVSRKRSLLTLVYQDAITDTTPLWNLVRKAVTQEMLDKIAVEHLRGRILLIATTNLDARVPVIWNITEIAAGRRPDALELVHRILIASAAIPGTFPPVMFDVVAGGKSYQEMHVDGATTAQVFAYPAAVHVFQLVPRERRLFIIRNARLDPEWAQTDRRILPIAMRAIACLVQYEGMGDLFTLHTLTQRDNIEYNLAFIPPTFDTPHTSLFDPTYMRALYETGERMAVPGTDWWWKNPPILLSGLKEEQPVY
ncbi:MAG TPA: patatin-like phospholipase family protein [Thermoanaerobaculia bacterium]|nr:patatin-like phospholipase family protein [Thermoanaerobaculia bacterium]